MDKVALQAYRKALEAERAFTRQSAPGEYGSPERKEWAAEAAQLRAALAERRRQVVATVNDDDIRQAIIEGLEAVDSPDASYRHRKFLVPSDIDREVGRALGFWDDKLSYKVRKGIEALVAEGKLVAAKAFEAPGGRPAGSQSHWTVYALPRVAQRLAEAQAQTQREHEAGEARAADFTERLHHLGVVAATVNWREATLSHTDLETLIRLAEKGASV